MISEEVLQTVTPAKPVPEVGSRGPGVEKCPKRLDSRLRGNDRKRHFSTFYKAAKIRVYPFSQDF
jgi:hypothetical protein